MKDYAMMTDAQFRCEAARCEFCEEKPCQVGCPANCSPADFIMAAKGGAPEDFQRAAAEIMTLNPLGGICGVVCPDTYCQAKCTHRTFGDGPLEIPRLQAYVVAKAKALGVMPKLSAAEKRPERVAVIGGGPAGLATAAFLVQRGYNVTLFERGARLGGAAALIPPARLPAEVLDSDIAWLMSHAEIDLRLETRVEDPRSLLSEGFAAVAVTAGLHAPMALGISGEERAVYGNAYLSDPAAFAFKGRVAIIGGGAIAVDCAVSALQHGAEAVEIIALEKWSELPLTPNERGHLEASGVEITGRTKVVAIDVEGEAIAGLRTMRVGLAKDQKFHPRFVTEIAGTEQVRADIQHVIIAIGNRAELPLTEEKGLFYAGDGWAGPSSVVEASASGKNLATQIDTFLRGGEVVALSKAHPLKSTEVLPGYAMLPVSLETDFFGRKIPSPFILSAAPPSDGYEQMKRALDAGWAGGIMKTAFDGVEIHIPAGYMFTIDAATYGNCDNVSEHPLSRVCDEIRRLCAEYPDRLIGASTGGPLSGNDAADKLVWQDNMRKLEEAGAGVVEFSLSCPQGGDGTEGDIVSQSANMTAKIIGWLMETSRADVPKLFKLTAAVTSVATIVTAVAEVLAKYPGKKAGVTLANTFPSLAFRPRRDGAQGKWDEGVVVGLSGFGVTAISNLTLASVAGLGVPVSGNGGPMNYRAAADFLALGCNSVQFCTVAMKEGVHIISHLESGLSHMMARLGMKSMADLIGCALPAPITDFMDLSADKQIPEVNLDACVSCGNCTRCSYFGVTLEGEDRKPQFHPEKCVGCSLCTKKCFAGALSMRDRTPEEAAAYQG